MELKPDIFEYFAHHPVEFYANDIKSIEVI